ncbi:MAG: hypothetical protein EU518_00955 [Promethearchaeota archaeon]|nr:MAG: hypothetical protein EU518_00955 [Candidatus Lokiarchaeota archaeon]
MKDEKPICLYNSGEEDRNALKEIIDAKIDCRFFGPISDENTPIIFFESMDFYGLSGTKAFIKRWKDNEETR